MRWEKYLAIAWVLPLAAFLLATASPAFAQYGIWTSADRHFSSGSADIPTSFGLTQGQTLHLGALSVFQTDTSFNMLNAGSGSYYHTSYFTPTSIQVPNGFVGYSISWAGNLHALGTYYAEYFRADFHLVYSTDYVFDASSLNVHGDWPVLSGPSGQNIVLTGDRSGTLTAGDWQFLLQFRGFYPDETLASTGHVASFSFTTVPEPASVGFVVAGAVAMLLSRRRARA
jgi:hypothetical protein